MYDIFIPCAEKDQKHLGLVISQIYECLDFNQIFVCSPNKLTYLSDSKVNYLLDSDVFDYDRSKITFRPNWTYQQILKMFFSYGTQDYFLSVDSDVFFLKPMKWFSEDKPIWRYGEDQLHLPYFLCNMYFLKLHRTLSHTGIGDIGFFNKNICKEILEYCNVKSPSEFLDLFSTKITATCQFSEFETYANYVNQFHPDLYKFEQVKFHKDGRRLDLGQSWGDGEIASLIQFCKNTDAEVLQAHSWKI